MNVEFIPKFDKDIKNLPTATKKQIKKLIETVKKEKALNEVTGVTKMKGHTEYYRVRLGHYRIGIKNENGTIIFMRAVKRNDIYKVFP